MNEIQYKNSVIYEVKTGFYCLIKDKIGFSECYRNLEQAQNEYDIMQALKVKNEVFRIEQEKRIKDENKKNEKIEQERKAIKQKENENHVIIALDKIMLKESHIITELYYKDNKSNKTITIKHIKDTKTFEVKISRNNKKIIFYSELLKKLVSIRNSFPCGKWY